MSLSQKLGSYAEEDSTQTLEELLNELESENLINSDERKQIEETGYVTIGSKTIEFNNDSVKLVGNVLVEEDGVYITVNFEKNIYEWALLKAQEATTEEKEEMVMEIFTWLYKRFDPNYNVNLEEATTFEEWITILEENTDQTLPKTVDEFINMIEIGDPDNPPEISIEEKLAVYLAESAVLMGRGQVITPDGETKNVVLDGDVKYKVTENGNYKFTGISYNGDNVEIQVNVNFSDQYLVPSRYNSSFFLRNAYGEFFEIKPEYEPKLKRDGEEEIIDLTPYISYGSFGNFDNVCMIGLWDVTPDEKFTGEIWLEKDGEIISWRGEFDVTVK